MRFDSFGRPVIAAPWDAINGIPAMVDSLGDLTDPGHNAFLVWDDGASALAFTSTKITFDDSVGRITLTPSSGNGLLVNQTAGSSGISISSSADDANLNLNGAGYPWRLYAAGGSLFAAGTFAIYDVTAGASLYDITTAGVHSSRGLGTKFCGTAIPLDTSVSHVAIGNLGGAAYPSILFNSHGPGANAKRWLQYVDHSNGSWNFRTQDDADSTSSYALVFTRSGIAIQMMQYGTADDYPSQNFYGRMLVSAPSSTGSQVVAKAVASGDYCGLRIQRTAGTATDWELYSPTGSTSFIIFGGADRVTISNAGGVRFNNYGAGTLVTDASGNITATSDERLKRNIRPFARGLAELLTLSPIQYNWSPDSGLDQTKLDYIGFSAQNVQAIMPEAVGEMRRVLSTTLTPEAAARLAAEEAVVEAKALKLQAQFPKMTLDEAKSIIGLPAPSKDAKDYVVEYEKDPYLTLDDRALLALLVNSVKELTAEVRAKV